jgi:hypothetical protein
MAPSGDVARETGADVAAGVALGAELGFNLRRGFFSARLLVLCFLSRRAPPTPPRFPGDAARSPETPSRAPAPAAAPRALRPPRALRLPRHRPRHRPPRHRPGPARPPAAAPAPATGRRAPPTRPLLGIFFNYLVSKLLAIVRYC